MKKAILSICFVLLFSFTPVRAEIIQIGLTGQVNYITDPCNLLENVVHQGDLITGFYIYNSLTPDSEPSENIGFYQHSTAPYGMSLTIGSLVFQTDWTNVDFSIGILNNYFYNYDQYSVTSHNNLPLNNGVTVDGIGLSLDDPSVGAAISSVALPLTAPDLSKWPSKVLWVDGSMYPFTCELQFYINGHVTSAYLIPEPTTLILLVTGGLLLNRRRFKKG
jgi:hypothetical protein